MATNSTIPKLIDPTAIYISNFQLIPVVYIAKIVEIEVRDDFKVVVRYKMKPLAGGPKRLWFRKIEESFGELFLLRWKEIKLNNIKTVHPFNVSHWY